jgi:hypothetical protein
MLAVKKCHQKKCMNVARVKTGFAQIAIQMRKLVNVVRVVNTFVKNVLMILYLAVTFVTVAVVKIAIQEMTVNYPIGKIQMQRRMKNAKTKNRP